MKNKTIPLLIEFFVLFILLPISLVLPFSIRLKILLVIIGFGYVLFVLKKAENINFRIKKDLAWRSFFRRILIVFPLVVLITTAYVWLLDKDALFFVPKTNFKGYLVILFVYTFFSVWPQEIIYRTFFFERYEKLFKSSSLFVFINAIVFSLAHLFFRNTLVLVLTFVGGLLFGYTYVRYRSTTAVSLEHALYGSWLYTVGMGQMLGFPGMEG